MVEEELLSREQRRARDRLGRDRLGRQVGAGGPRELPVAEERADPAADDEDVAGPGSSTPGNASSTPPRATRSTSSHAKPAASNRIFAATSSRYVKPSAAAAPSFMPAWFSAQSPKVKVVADVKWAMSMQPAGAIN